MSDATARVLVIAVMTNLATVAFLLLDKLAFRHFGIGTEFSVGLYFLFFDLATRAEAFYLLLAVPVTNYLFVKARNGDMPRGEICRMAAGCVVVGALFGGFSVLVVPALYDVTLEGFELLPWIFGVYVAARGIRFLIKAVCNATGLHTILLMSNYLVLAAGVVLLGGAILAQGPALSVTAVAAMLTVAHVCRTPVLLKVLYGRVRQREPAGLGVSHDA